MGGGPGGVAHDGVDAAAAAAVEQGEEAPVEQFAVRAEGGGGGGERGEHVGADGRIVDICAGWDIEEELCEGESERVAHGINEDVRDEEAEGVPGEDQGAKGLADEGETGPCGSGDPVAGGEKEEADAGGVEVDVEAVLKGGGVSRGRGIGIIQAGGAGTSTRARMVALSASWSPV